MLAYTGLRFGELAALRVQDFDMLRRCVNVRQSVTEVGKIVWSSPKKPRTSVGAVPSVPR